MKNRLKVGVGAVIVSLGILLIVWSSVVVGRIPVSRVPVILGLLGLYLAGAFVIGLGIAVCAKGIKQIATSTSN